MIPNKDNPLSFLYPLMASPRLPGNTKTTEEDRHTIEFANRLRAWTLDGTFKGVWFHCPNEGKRSRQAGALLKAKGLLPGVPDFMLASSGGTDDVSSGFIEMKTAKGRLTPAQELFQQWCDHAGVPFAVCRSADEAETTLREWGMLA